MQLFYMPGPDGGRPLRALLSLSIAHSPDRTLLRLDDNPARSARSGVGFDAAAAKLARKPSPKALEIRLARVEAIAAIAGDGDR